MQNRFVGDIGDFGKYGLLRKLCSGTGPRLTHFRLGVVWYLVPDDVPTSERRLRVADPDLFATLRTITGSDTRTVQTVAQSGVLPQDTVFFDRLLRQADRDRWAESAVEAVARCDIVFLDPDNGFESEHARDYPDQLPKYVLFEELQPYVQRGQSLVIYHQLGRNGSCDEQIEVCFRRLRASLPQAEGVFAMRYLRGQPRVFFVVPATVHKPILTQRAQGMISAVSPWAEHFMLVTPTEAQ